MKNLNGYSQHHAIPRSRGGTFRHTVLIPKEFHEHWHALFGAMDGKCLYDLECIRFLTMVCHAMNTRSIITREDLERWRRISLGANDHYNPRPNGMPMRRDDDGTGKVGG